MQATKRIDTRKLVLLAILTALVIVVQVIAATTRAFLPIFSLTLVLMPITIGAALIGRYAGAWLGLAFGFAVLISGDAAPFLAFHPIGTVVTVMMKGLFAGWAAGAVYRLMAHKSKTMAATAAAVVCPIVNTGVFVMGCYAFFLPLLREWASAGSSAHVTSFIFLVLIGINFLIELGINLVLSPTIIRLIQYGQDRRERV